MQKIVLKKEVKAKYPIEGLSLVNLEDEIEYKNTSEGVYASGVIKISGEYYKGVRSSKFFDEIDVEIFAPFDDLESRNDLNLSILDFDYHINEDLILFSVIIDVKGLKEIKHSFPSTDFEEEKEVVIEEKIEEKIEEQIIEREGNDNASFVFEEKKPELILNSINKEEIKTPIETKTSSKEQSKICWSFYVVMKDDTYESISNELKLDYNLLKTLNKNKTLTEGSLIVLPE